MKESIAKEKFTLNKINYFEVLSSCKPIIVLKDLSKNVMGFHLRKNVSVENIKEVFMPPELISNYDEIDYEYVMTCNFGQIITEFVDIMNSNFSSSNLTILYNNVNELSIEKLHFNDQKEKLKNMIFCKGRTDINVASYSGYYNRIRVSEEAAEVDLPHELFHMSSSFHDEETKIDYCGFEQINFDECKYIGTGINEGYTELMVSKYYDDEILSDSPNYQYLREVAKNIERIVGKDKMEQLYLNANLKGLVDELTKYLSYNDTMKFIATTDYLCQTLNDGRKKQKEKNKILEQLKFVNIIIIACATRKTLKLFSENMISPDEFVPTISKNIGSLHDVCINGETYEAAPTREQLGIIIMEILKKHGIEASFIDDQKAKIV